MIENIPYVIVGILIIVGLYGIIFRRNLIKIIIGISIVESAVNLFLVSTGYREKGIAPIFTNSISTLMVFPTPQALTLTSIVIGVAVTSLMLAIVVKIYQNSKSLDSKNISKLQK